MGQTIAAIATPNAAGGIGIIRISGESAISIAEAVFHSANGTLLRDLPGYSCVFGSVVSAEGPVDQAIALLFRAPRSYTGEDVVELQCHGGLFPMCRNQTHNGFCFRKVQLSI